MGELFTKSEYPKVLEAFTSYMGQDYSKAEYSEIVLNATNEANFKKIHSNKEVKERKLNEQELKQLGLTEHIKYKTPKWVYYILGFLILAWSVPLSPKKIKPFKGHFYFMRIASSLSNASGNKNESCEATLYFI